MNKNISSNNTLDDAGKISFLENNIELGLKTLFKEGHNLDLSPELKDRLNFEGKPISPEELTKYGISIYYVKGLANAINSTKNQKLISYYQQLKTLNATHIEDILLLCSLNAQARMEQEKNIPPEISLMHFYG